MASTLKKIVLWTAAIAALAVLALAALAMVGYSGTPEGQRDAMWGRDTPAARMYLESQGQPAAAQPRAPAAAPPATGGGPITVTSPSPIDLKVERGATVSTPCFEFIAPTASRVRGDGCRIVATSAVDGASGLPYLEAELLDDDPPGMSLSQSALNLRESLRRASTGYRGASPGPFDLEIGRYLGERSATLAGLPALEMRWGIAAQPDVEIIDLSCGGGRAGDCPVDTALAPFR